MDWLEYLKEQRKKDLELLNELENKRRCEDNPRLKHKWEVEIEEIKQGIKRREYKDIQVSPSLLPEEEVEIEKVTPRVKKTTYDDKRKPNSNRIQKYFKKPPINILIIAFLAVIGILVIYWCLINFIPRMLPNSNICQKNNINLPIYKYLSCGEKTLILEPLNSISHYKKDGIKYYALNNNYPKAVELLGKARNAQKSDPETLIYLNNAQIEKDKVKANTIAVAVPISKNLDVALELLRGVAQAQEQFNNEAKIKNKIRLKILIADDANDKIRAKEIAEILVKQPHILAVIGHYASEITLAAMPIYQRGNLLLVSPGSTTTKLPGEYKFFFRTVPTLRVNTQGLASYLKIKNSQERVAVFYNQNSDFSRSFRDGFHASLRANQGEMIEDKSFELSDPFFSPSKAIKTAQRKKVTAFIMIPDGGTSSYSLHNAIKLIKANYNYGHYFMVGANTLSNVRTLLVGQEAEDHLVVSVPWIAMTSPKSNFAKEAEKFWQGGEVNDRTAAAYDAAQALIKALDTTDEPTPSKLQKTLSTPGFEAPGASKPVKFSGGDRDQEDVELAKIVRSKCSEFGYIFVPEKYSQDDIKQLDNSCSQ